MPREIVEPLVLERLQMPRSQAGQALGIGKLQPLRWRAAARLVPISNIKHLLALRVMDRALEGYRYPDRLPALSCSGRERRALVHPVEPSEPRRVISIEVPKAPTPGSREVLSRVPTPYFGSGAFLGRIAILGVVASLVFGVLALRLVVAPGAERLPAPSGCGAPERPRRGPAGCPGGDPRRQGKDACDDRRLLRLVPADPARLGTTAPNGRWRPNAYGSVLLERVARLALASQSTLVARIRASLAQSPYAPAVILAGVPEDLFSYLSERADDYRGVSVTELPERTYPQGSIGSAFLGLVGQLSSTELAQGAYPWASPGELVGQSGVEAAYDRDPTAGSASGESRSIRRAASSARCTCQVDRGIRRACSSR